MARAPVSLCAVGADDTLTMGELFRRTRTGRVVGRLDSVDRQRSTLVSGFEPVGEPYEGVH